MFNVQANDGNLLPRTTPQSDKRRVNCDTCAKHRCSQACINVIWDLEGEVLVSTHVARVAALRDGAIRVRCAVGVNHVGTVVLLIRFAIAARQVCLNLSTDTDAVANLDGLDILSNLDRLAHDFVANADW